MITKLIFSKLRDTGKHQNKGLKQSAGGTQQKSILKNFAKFTGKQLYQSLFFNKVAGHTYFFRTPLVAASERGTMQQNGLRNDE